MTPTLVLPDGRRVELDDDIVVGRAPIAPASAPSARTLSLPAPTVSKTHALIGHDADGVWLIDLHSSNGSEALDDAGHSERAVPGRRMAIPAGSHIRVGTDTIITIDAGVPLADDDPDRTVMRPAPPAPAPLAAPPPSEQPPPSPPSEQPPPSPPSHQPSPQTSQKPPPQPPSQPPPPSAPPTQQFAQTPPGSASHAAGTRPGPGPRYDIGADPNPDPATTGTSRSAANTIGAVVVLVWSAIGFANLRDWTPDFVFDALDGRIIDFFTVPDRFTVQFAEFFDFLSLPDSLDFLARGADVGPVVAVVMAVVVLAAPKLVARLLLVALVAIPMILLVGLLVTIGRDSFDFLTDEIDRFVPWFVLPAIGAGLLLLPARRPSTAETPPSAVTYAPNQPPGPPASGPSYS